MYILPLDDSKRKVEAQAQRQTYQRSRSKDWVLKESVIVLSPHADGSKCEIIGTLDLEYKLKLEQFEAHIDNIYRKYGLECGNVNYNRNGDLNPKENLSKANCIVYEGQDRQVNYSGQ